MNSLREIAEFLKTAKKAIVCGHAMPDGDSVGSVLAMRLMLSSIGVESYATSPDPVPAMYDFLPGADKITLLSEAPDGCDFAVILDCTDLGRLGDKDGQKIANIPNIVNIDHHVSNGGFGKCWFVDEKAAATGEIVFELAKIMGITIDKDIAINLYTAIVMDTGSFRFDNTTEKTHEITAELVRTGIEISEINRNLFERKDLTHLKMLGYALGQLKLTAEGKVAWIAIPLKVMQEMGAKDEHADGIINYPRLLNGVEIGMLVREITPGRFKVGFRSKQKVDVNKLASRFGGGGHPRAAGCSIEGSLQEVEARVLQECMEVLGY